MNVNKPSLDYATGNYTNVYDKDVATGFYKTFGTTVEKKRLGGDNVEHRISLCPSELQLR